MKAAISIPDPIFEKGELLAKRLGITRSKLYANALGAYVASHSPGSITDAMNAALDAVDNGPDGKGPDGKGPDGNRPDGFSQKGARSILERSEW